MVVVLLLLRLLTTQSKEQAINTWLHSVPPLWCITTELNEASSRELVGQALQTPPVAIADDTIRDQVNDTPGTPHHVRPSQEYVVQFIRR